jgi:hypothetical protein
MNLTHEGWGKSVEALNLTASRAHLPIADQRASGCGIDGSRCRQNWLQNWGCRVVFLIALALCSSVIPPVHAGDVAPSEAQVKAAFLLNFPKYVQWPTSAFTDTNSPIIVAILDAGDVADEFATMSEGRSIDGRMVRLVRATSIEQCRDAHIVFIGSEESRKSHDLLSKLGSLNILTVGESDGFLDAGGMINLARRERRVVLEVNMDSIRKGGLKVSSKLLALATVKGGKK